MSVAESFAQKNTGYIYKLEELPLGIDINALFKGDYHQENEIAVADMLPFYNVTEVIHQGLSITGNIKSGWLTIINLSLG